MADEAKKMENYKGMFFGIKQGQYQDPATGAHFEYFDMVNRLTILQLEIEENVLVSNEKKSSFKSSRKRVAMNLKTMIKGRSVKKRDTVRETRDSLGMVETCSPYLPNQKRTTGKIAQKRGRAEFGNSINLTTAKASGKKKRSKQVSKSNIMNSGNRLSKARSLLSGMDNSLQSMPLHYKVPTNIPVDSNNHNENQFLSNKVMETIDNSIPNNSLNPLVPQPDTKETVPYEVVNQKGRAIGSRNSLQTTDSIQSLNLQGDSQKAKGVTMVHQRKNSKQPFHIY